MLRRSFDSLAEELTRILEDRVCGAVRNIYSTSGKKVNEIIFHRINLIYFDNEMYKSISDLYFRRI